MTNGAGWVQNLLYFIVSIATVIFGGGVLWTKSKSSEKRHDEAEAARKDIYGRIESLHSEHSKMISETASKATADTKKLEVELYKNFPQNKDLLQFKKDMIDNWKDFEKRFEKQLDRAFKQNNNN